MILTCPQCTTRYAADAAKFMPSGRTVRCAKCGHSWFQSPPEPEPEPQIASTSAPEPASARHPAPEAEASHRTEYGASAIASGNGEAPAAPLASRIGVAVGWIGLAAIVVLIVGAAVVYRQQIVRLWPQASSFYSLVGLKTDASDIVFRNVTYQRFRQDGQQVLSVSGAVVNTGSHELPVPQIRVVLSADDKREVYHWNFTPNASLLAPGQRLMFLTRMASPPSAAHHLEVRFVRAGE